MGDPQALLHRILEGMADYIEQRGEPPQLLRLPVRQGLELATLGRNHLGELADRVMQKGVDAFQGEYFFGVKVRILHDKTPDFSFE